MNISMQKFGEEIGLFKARLAPTDQQKQYLAFTEEKVRKELQATEKESGQSIERVLLTAICGELRTDRQKAEFASRLILLNILTSHE